MEQHVTTTDGPTDDYDRARRLYFAAYTLTPGPKGRPSPTALRLLRAAALAWERHLDRERAERAAPRMSDALRDWCHSQPR